MNALRKDALMRRALRGADVLPLPALVRAASAPRPVRGTLRARRHASAALARRVDKPAPAPRVTSGLGVFAGKASGDGWPDVGRVEWQIKGSTGPTRIVSQLACRTCCKAAAVGYGFANDGAPHTTPPFSHFDAFNPYCSACHVADVRAFASEAGLLYCTGNCAPGVPTPGYHHKLPPLPVAPALADFEAWRKALEKRIREADKPVPPLTPAAGERERKALLKRAGKPEACEYGEIYGDGTTEFLRYNGAAKIEAALERANGLRRLAGEAAEGPAKGIPQAPSRWKSPNTHEEHEAMLNILEREHAHVEVRGGLLCRVACPADCTRKAAK